MKKKYFTNLAFASLTFFSFGLYNASAQVGIGTVVPSTKSALDIFSNTAGVLFPRVTTAERIAIAPAATDTGLKVYDTTTKSYWYWDGTVWVEQGVASSDWKLAGNSGTTPGTHFIGTTGPQDLRFKTNSTDRLNLSDATGQLQSYYTGTAAAPAYSWNGDTDTGVFQNGANTLSFTTNGTEKMRIESDGDISIAASAAPDSSAKLDIVSTNKGVSFPNVNLISETDATTVLLPKPGLMIYNTNPALPCGSALYFNNGTAATPIWACFTKTVRQYHAYNTAQRTNITSNTATLQPGCFINITVPTGQIADIKIDAVLGGRNNSNTAGKYSTFDAIIYVDGAPLTQGGWNRTTILNPTPGINAFNVCSMSTTWQNVPAGAHTIELYSRRTTGTSGVDLGGDCTTTTNCGEIHAIVTYK